MEMSWDGHKKQTGQHLLSNTTNHSLYCFFVIIIIPSFQMHN